MPRLATSNAHRKRSRIVGAAVCWFHSKRPEGMNDTQHLQQWWINCGTQLEINLAHAVAEWCLHTAEAPAGIAKVAPRV